MSSSEMKARKGKMHMIKYSNNRFSLAWVNPKVESEILDPLTNTLCCDAEDTYEQSAWMGRGCYKKLGDGYLFLKGVGPTAGSESFRTIMELFWKNHSPIQKGGCVRLVNEDFPVLIEYYYDSESRIKLFDPRPEGYSIFGAVLREAVISKYLHDLGFLVPQPIAVYHTLLCPPWKPYDVEDMGRYCRQQFLDLMDLGSDCEVAISKVQYEDVRAGLLARYFISNIRFQEVVEAFLHNPSDLAELYQRLDREAHSAGWENWIARFEHGMIQNLNSFVKYGIVHSNLHTHYQNCTIAGEICDWDAAVAVAGESPVDVSEPVIQALRTEEDRFHADMLKYYHMDVQSSREYSKAAMLQIYAIVNCCAFARFLADSFKDAPSCDRYSQQYTRSVVEHLMRIITPEEKDALSNILSVSDDQNLRLRMVGKSSIFGWNCLDRELDYSKHICNEEDAEQVHEDILRLKYLLQSYLN